MKICRLITTSLILLSLNAYAEEKAAPRPGAALTWNSLQTNIIGKSPKAVDAALKSRGLDWNVEVYQCPANQLDSCKEKYGEYCSCVFFSDTDPNKSLEAKTYVAAVKDDKIVEYKMSSAILPANLWKAEKAKSEPLRVSTFAGDLKPYNVHFDSIIPFGDKMPVVKDPDQVGRYLAQWKLNGNTEVAAVLWCSRKPRKPFKGKVRDCYVQEASFTSIRKFPIPKGTEKYAY